MSVTSFKTIEILMQIITIKSLCVASYYNRELEDCFSKHN